ncbi:MAG: hypothetical protein GY932_05605, partial [Arcobacter sp.]|nr:hypothetical protein [Arcobacter sp.]
KDIDEPTYGADFNGDGDSLDLNLDLSKRSNPINQDIKSMTYDDFKNVTTGTQDINALFAPGTAWWAKFVALENNISINDVTLSQTLTFIKNTKSINGNTYIIEFYISKTNANKIITWWENKYRKLGVYSIRPYTGEQCTTTVIDSLKAGGINDIDFSTLTPQGILEDLKTEVKSTSKQKKGNKAKITLIKNEK